MNTNPLMQDNPLPPFKQLKNEHMLEAVRGIVESNQKQVAAMLADLSPPSWTQVALLESLENDLAKAWSPISHLNAVKNSEQLRTIYDDCLPILSDYATALNQNKDLYQKYKTLKDTQSMQLTATQNKVLDNALRDFHLSGIDLAETEQQRFAEIKKQLSQLASKFDQQVLDATMAWTAHFDNVDDLKGLPETALAAAKNTAQEKNLAGYVITLEFPSYFSVITYCENAQLRKDIYTAYCTRASDQGPYANQFDNSAIMAEIIALRQELAHLLGFNNYIDYSLQTKMAKSEQEVMAFLQELAARSRPQAEKELAELKRFVESEYDQSELAAWDIPFYSEKLRIHRYNVSQEALRPFFPKPKVLTGLFQITETLFSVQIEAATCDQVWHHDVDYFEVIDSNSGKKIAAFFLDLYARPNKRGGAWMADYQGRFKNDQGLQLPVAYLTCNFAAPSEGKPALLTHDEVTTLFHEFGHGLHHMLTKIDHLSVSGINGVPWDAVELPSQFMENFCWCEQTLALIAEHVDTQEALPKELLDRMLAAKNFQSAMQMVRQLEFALFDLSIHTSSDDPVVIQAALDQVRAEVAVIIPPSFNRFQHGFAHIFSGGYAAGYYSYKWAEVLSADAFSLFEEQGILDQKTGLAFKQQILEQGGSAEPMDLFKAFRGRPPKTDALLRHSGIT